MVAYLLRFLFVSGSKKTIVCVAWVNVLRSSATVVNVYGGHNEHISNAQCLSIAQMVFGWFYFHSLFAALNAPE